jgi:hypothetical protein
MNPRSIASTALDVLSNLIAPKEGQKKKTINDITLDELRREKVRLDQEEKKMLNRIRDIESQKKQLFESGVKNPSEREQKIMARKIKELDVEAKNMDRNLEFFSKQLRILNGFVQLKENQRLLSEMGVSSVLGNIDLQDLQIYIDKATLDGEFHLDKFNEILGTLEASGDTLAPMREDDDVTAIVKAMQQAREAADPSQAVTDKYSEVDQLLSKNKEKPEGE